MTQRNHEWWVVNCFQFDSHESKKKERVCKVSGTVMLACSIHLAQPDAGMPHARVFQVMSTGKEK